MTVFVIIRGLSTFHTNGMRFDWLTNIVFIEVHTRVLLVEELIRQ